MGTTALRQLLKSLCSNSKWKYAVFWKLKQTSSMTLVWGDGYCEYSRLRESNMAISDVHLSNMKNLCSQYGEANMQDEIFSEYPVGLAVAEMSSHQYRWGEGFVGKVACTGNHCWVFSDDYISGGFNFKSAPEFQLQLPNEWIPQFQAGIKTILLAPVFPHGVLQLGSLERVEEDVATVAYIESAFSSFQNGVGCYASDLIESNTLAQSLPNAIDTMQEWAPRISQYNDSESNMNIKSCSMMTASLDESQLMQPEKEVSHFELSCLEDDSQALFDYSNLNAGCSQGFPDGSLNSYLGDDIIRQGLRSWDVNDALFNATSNICNFPMDNEMGDEFQPCSTFESTVHSPRMAMCNSYGGFSRESDQWSTEAGATGNLLEAVVANAYRSSNNRASTGMDTVKSSSSHLRSSRLQSQHEGSTSMGDDSGNQSYITSVAVAGEQIPLPDSPSLTSFNSMISTLIYKEQQKNGTADLTRKSRTNSKRSRVGDSPKLRPKDRQMFQDRLKELRQLVPSGAKLTIDGLLDQTIKHMLYLRNATDQAEKLRQWSHLKVADHNELKSPGTKHDHQNGATWAVDVESEKLLCPIIVKDLDPPGHLLIKVLCSDYGLFLEIAQLIRQSELTILKGVMEDHADKTWALFIVEAPEGIHRMDVFLPLLQILQHKASPVSKY